MSGTTTTRISGQRARTDSNLQFESGLMRTFARGAGQGTEIVRLDQDKMYSVDNKKKTYIETTFAETRAQMEKVSQQMQEAQASRNEAQYRARANLNGDDHDHQCDSGKEERSAQRIHTGCIQSTPRAATSLARFIARTNTGVYNVQCPIQMSSVLI